MKRGWSSPFENRFSLALTVLALSASWGWLFWTSFAQLLEHWNSEDYSYCYLVPPLAVYLAYFNRVLLKDSLGGKVWPGYLGLSLSALLFLSGRMGSLETLVYLSMWLSVVSIVVLLAGARSLRALRFPLAILFFSIPLPPFLTQLLTFNLRLLSTAIAVDGLHLLGISAYREGNIIDLGFTQMQVVDACSGLRYLLPTVIVALVMGYLFNRKLIDRVVLAVAAVPVSVFINAVRIVVVVILAKFVSPKFGEEGFLHDFQGWLIFMFSFGILLLVSTLLRRFTRRREQAILRDSQSTRVPTTMHAKYHCAGGLIAALFLLLLHFLGENLVSAHVSPGRNDFSSFAMTIGDWEGKRIFLDQKILDSLWADDYLTGTFHNNSTGNSLLLLISYYNSQTTHHTAHAPTSCLLGRGWSLLKKQVLSPNSATGRAFSVQQMVMQKDGKLLLANFWFQQRGRVITNEYVNKLYLLWDALTQKRTDGALIRVEMPLLPGQGEEQAQSILDKYTMTLSGILKTYIPE